MALEPVNCNECGTLIEVAPKTRFVTCARCKVRLEVHWTGTSVFTEKLAEEAITASAPDMPPFVPTSDCSSATAPSLGKREHADAAEHRQREDDREKASSADKSGKGVLGGVASGCSALALTIVGAFIGVWLAVHSVKPVNEWDGLGPIFSIFWGLILGALAGFAAFVFILFFVKGYKDAAGSSNNS